MAEGPAVDGVAYGTLLGMTEDWRWAGWSHVAMTVVLALWLAVVGDLPWAGPFSAGVFLLWWLVIAPR